MSKMFITTFETPDGAAKLAEALKPLREEYKLEVQDITIVTRDADGEIDLNTPGNVPLLQMAGGAFWGLMFGAIVTFPLAGAAAGVAVGALTARDHDPGVPTSFTTKIGETLQPGGSALCLLIRDLDPEALRDRIEATGLSGDLVSAPVPTEMEPELRRALAA
jgi:uncharacterized membrane protein